MKIHDAVGRDAEPDIDVHRNWVRIEGTVINRPSRIAPSQWIEFWEKKEEERSESRRV